MKRKLVTLHKAVKAREAAQLLALLAEQYNDPTVEAHGDEIGVYQDTWNDNRVSTR